MYYSDHPFQMPQPALRADVIREGAHRDHPSLTSIIFITMVHAEFRAILAISSCIPRFVKFGFVTIEIAIIQEYGAEKNSLAFFKWRLHFKEKEIFSKRAAKFGFIFAKGSNTLWRLTKCDTAAHGGLQC